MRALPALGVAVALAFVSPEALAEGAEEGAARALFREGLALHESRDFARALAKYRAAYARWQNPKILTNIGTAAWELGRFAEAASAYDQFLAEAPADDVSRPEVEKALGQVLPRIGTLNVTVAGGYTRVRVDGTPVDPTRIDRIRVEPGSHTLDALDASGATARQSVEVAAGETKHLSLGPARSSEPGTAAVEATPGGTPGDASSSAPLVQRSTLPWIIGGLGATSLLASGVFFGLRGGAIDELDRDCIDGICPDSSRGTIDRANDYGLVSAVTLGVGLAGIGTAVVLLVSGGGSTEPENASAFSVSATGGPGVARASARLRF